jgi:2'-5' RNA ligase
MDALCGYESSSSSDASTCSESEMQQDLGNLTGNWNTFVFVKLSLDEDVINRVLQLQMSSDKNIVEIKEKHISCSKTFVLKSFQIDAFLAKMEEICSTITRFKVSFNRIRRFKSPKNAFISLQVQQGANQLQRLTSQINEILESYHQDTYWKRPKFHTSIAVSSDRESDFSALKELEHELSELTTLVTKISCKVGNRLYSWNLV